LRVHAGLADRVVNESEFIDDGAEWCDRFAELLSGLAVLFEFPEGAKPGAEAVLERFDAFAEVRRLAVALDEFRLEVEEIDVAGAAGHEELDNAFGPGGVVKTAIRARLPRIGEKTFAAEERGERDAAEPAARVEQELTTIHDGLPRLSISPSEPDAKQDG